MKVIILASGKSTRLLPLTKETPQCLLRIKGKEILTHQLAHLKKAGMQDILVVCGYLADKVETFCKGIRVKTALNPFYDISGLAMSLWVVKDELKHGFLMVYSDVVFDPAIIEGVMKHKGDIYLAIQKNRPREEAEKVIEEKGVLRRMTKKKVPEGNGEFVGIARFSEKGAKLLLDELHAVAKKNIAASLIEVIDTLIRKGITVRAYDIKDADYVDIDFPADIKRAIDIFEF
ncbi:MAG: phosphocholine cytidylyltransferase family protein [archaeon]